MLEATVAIQATEVGRGDGKLVRLRSNIRKSYQHGSRWFHAKVLPTFPPKAQSYILNFEAYIVSLY